MKKLVTALMLSAMLIVSVPVFADEVTDDTYVDYVNVIVNGKTMEFDTPAYTVNDRTVVPMRAIFEELGASVEWIDESQLIIATKNAKLITLKIGSDMMYIADVSKNLTSSEVLDVAPFLNETGDRTLIPLRAISEALDANVEWDEATSTVTITL